jgi:hypothetical protein
MRLTTTSGVWVGSPGVGPSSASIGSCTDKVDLSEATPGDPTHTPEVVVSRIREQEGRVESVQSGIEQSGGLALLALVCGLPPLPEYGLGRPEWDQVLRRLGLVASRGST